MNAEQIISKTLDGWFFRMDAEGCKVRATRVPHDFIPNHRPLGLTPSHDDPSKMSNGMAIPWTDEKDDTVISMRASGAPWRVIGLAVNRCGKSVAERHRYLTSTEVA